MQTCQTLGRPYQPAIHCMLEKRTERGGKNCNCVGKILGANY